MNHPYPITANPITTRRLRATIRPIVRESATLGVIAVTWFFLIACTGCQPSPLARKTLDSRVEMIGKTADMWATAEEPRPARMERAGRFIQDSETRHAAQLARTGRHVEFWFNRDVERVQQRAPQYRDKLGQILWGQPEDIEYPAIILFF